MLDEPSAGLDPRSVSWLTDFIITQGSAGKTVVLSTHDLALVEATADCMYWMNIIILSQKAFLEKFSQTVLYLSKQTL
jgi:ABC-type multidrug transport system ATPase subunit